MKDHLNINTILRDNEKKEKQQLEARIEALSEWIAEHRVTHPDFEEKVREYNACSMRLAIKNRNVTSSESLDY